MQAFITDAAGVSSTSPVQSFSAPAQLQQAPSNGSVVPAVAMSPLHTGSSVPASFLQLSSNPFVPNWVIHVVIEVCVVGAISLYLNSRISEVERKFAGLNDYLLREWQAWSRDQAQKNAVNAQSLAQTLAQVQSQVVHANELTSNSNSNNALAAAQSSGKSASGLAQSESESATKTKMARMQAEITALRKHCLFLTHQHNDILARMEMLEKINHEEEEEEEELEELEEEEEEEKEEEQSFAPSPNPSSGLAAIEEREEEDVKQETHQNLNQDDKLALAPIQSITNSSVDESDSKDEEVTESDIAEELEEMDNEDPMIQSKNAK